MLKAVFFDVYGTVAGFHPSRYEVQSEACAYFDIEVTPAGILNGYAAADAYMSRQNLTNPVQMLDSQSHDLLFAEYERLVLEGSGVRVSQERALEIFRRVQGIPHDLVVFDDVVPGLDHLKSMGLTVGLISNMDRGGDELVNGLGLRDNIDFVVTSGQVGVAKPHPKIFQVALGTAGTNPDEVVHVGDQLVSDVDGAISAGIIPVLIDRDGNHENFSDCPRITTLLDLPAVLTEVGV